MELILHYIQEFSYIGMFVFLLWCGVGFPLPEDIILIAGGFLVYKGVTDFWLTNLVAFAGVLIGDSIIFYFGKKFGLDIMTHRRFRRILSEKRLVKIEKKFNKYGNTIVFIARFMAGLRAPIYLSAGALGVRYTSFVFWDFLASFISIPIVIWVGKYFGAELEIGLKYVRRAEYLAVFIGVLVLIYIFRLRRGRLRRAKD